MDVKNKAGMCLFAMLALANGHSYGQQVLIKAQDGKAGDHFGYSASIDGNRLLIGSPMSDINNKSDAGAAYIFELGATGWVQQAKLVTDPIFADDTVGGNVALDNEFALLGVMRRDGKGEDSGAVISFEHQQSTWSQQQILTAPDGKPGDAFGQTIALTETHLVIGAPRSDTLAKDSGSAYIYTREKGTWQFQTKITASDGAQGDLFGISVAIDGNTVLVGADLNDEKAENAGAVYVFVLDNEQWIQQAKLMASDGNNTDIFGVRVSLSENAALISARRDDIDGIGVDAGSAYIFERENNVWSQKLKLTSPDGQADDRFGRGVAIDKGTAIISAMNHDANGKDTGALYVYKKLADGWRYTSKVTALVGYPNDRFGWNVDLNDGTAVITSPNHNGNGEDSGAVFIQDLYLETQSQKNK